jgi:hypothetical protein
MSAWSADAIMIAKIATGEISDTVDDDGKKPAAVALGNARAEDKPAAEQRSEIATKAAPSQQKEQWPFFRSRIERSDGC